MARFRVGEVTIHALDLEAAADTLLDRGFLGDVHLCNAFTIASADPGTQYAAILDGASLNLADGFPLAWVARRLGLRHLTSPVRGPDLMALTLHRGTSTRTRHYLYGSTTEVLNALQAQISARWPDAEIVGAESPSFGPITDEHLSTSINEMQRSACDIVWVGMGAPKQDELCARMFGIWPSTYVAIGAAFDFIAGTKPRAPQSMQTLGLEWLFRLYSEPGRLWKRYLIGNSKFIWRVIRRRPRLLLDVSERRP